LKLLKDEGGGGGERARPEGGGPAHPRGAGKNWGCKGPTNSGDKGHRDQLSIDPRGCDEFR